MTGIRYENGVPMMWCVWCRNYVRADVPHKCVNTTMFKTQENK